ncbi:MAG: hypothetical protein QHI38_09350 [Armatimonadota bacterium]|nr:hypothetical protein [Armatimonadota bacterium]
MSVERRGWGCSEMDVVFVEQPVVGQRVSFFANGQHMSSSPVIRVDADPARPGWFCVFTASGHTYSGPLQPRYQPTAYATQQPGYSASAPGSVASQQVKVGVPTVRPVPPEIAGQLNWGAFLLTLFWSVNSGGLGVLQSSSFLSTDLSSSTFTSPILQLAPWR